MATNKDNLTDLQAAAAGITSSDIENTVAELMRVRQLAKEILDKEVKIYALRFEYQEPLDEKAKEKLKNDNSAGISDYKAARGDMERLESAPTKKQIMEIFDHFQLWLTENSPALRGLNFTDLDKLEASLQRAKLRQDVPNFFRRRWIIVRDAITSALNSVFARDTSKKAIDEGNVREQVSLGTSDSSTVALSPEDKAVRALSDLKTDLPAPPSSEVNELKDAVAANPRAEPLGSPPIAMGAPPTPPSDDVKLAAPVSQSARLAAEELPLPLPSMARNAGEKAASELKSSAGVASAASVSDGSLDLPGIEDEETRQNVADAIAAFREEDSLGLPGIAVGMAATSNAAPVAHVGSNVAALVSVPVEVASKSNPVISALQFVWNFVTNLLPVRFALSATERPSNSVINSDALIFEKLSGGPLGNHELEFINRDESKELQEEYKRMESRHDKRMQELQSDRSTDAKILKEAKALEMELIFKDRQKFRQKLHAAGFESVERHDPTVKLVQHAVEALVASKNQQLNQEEVDAIIEPHFNEAAKFLGKVMLMQVDTLTLSAETMEKRRKFIELERENGVNPEKEYTFDNFMKKYKDVCHLLNAKDIDSSLGVGVLANQGAREARKLLGLNENYDTIFNNEGHYSNCIYSELKLKPVAITTIALVDKLRDALPARSQTQDDATSKVNEPVNTQNFSRKL